jgi:DNA replication and repair protein RecF
MHLEKGMEAALCSTGEQKALLLAMVLAEARAGHIWHGRVPIVLLDEVVAHLDAKKRAELFEEMAALQAQCWLTGTDEALFSGFENAQFFHVAAGVLAAK